MSNPRNYCKPSPILKWVGGKRQLLGDILCRLPKEFGRYYEPFFGGGAALLAIAPKKAVINDLNSELINLYEVVRDNPDALIRLLESYDNTEEFFYQIRNLDLDKNAFAELSRLERAARTVYLNRTCFNGVYRVNKNGHFNVPFAKLKSPNIVRKKEIIAMSKFFNENDIVMRCGDFERAVGDAEPGDFIYFDPPYDPLPGQSSFVGYTERNFNESSLKRLVSLCDYLSDKGVLLMVSNSATENVRNLFSGERYHVFTVKAKRTVNSKPDQRGEIDEFIITNYGVTDI